MEISFCYLMDNYYAMPTSVSLTSMKLNKKTNTKINIYLLCNNVSKDNINKIMELCSIDFNIKIIDVSKNINISKYSINDISANTTAIYKFYIPEYINDLDKIIYLDGDTILNKGFEEINNYDLGDNYICAVRDQNILYFNKINYKNYSYFNSGVLIMNLKKMRDDNIIEKLFNYRNNCYNGLMDQDSYNYVLKNNIKLIPFKYNVQVSVICNYYNNSNKYSLFNINKKLDLNINDIKDLYNLGIIIHYNGIKPWNNNKIPLYDLWLKYYRLSPYKDNVLNNYKYKNKKKNKFKLLRVFKNIRRYYFLKQFENK